MSRDLAANASPPPWRLAGMLYYPLASAIERDFGRRVWKVSVDGGFSCPNLDGTAGNDGCIFCNARAFSPGRRLDIPSITTQIDEGLKRIERRYGADQLIAYFQPSTNTYAPVERLRAAYAEAVAHPNIVGLAVGTRPDCADSETLELLAGFAKETWLQVEFGVQTVHQRSLDWLGRGHDAACIVDAIARAKGLGLRVGAHVILGIPGETAFHVRQTAWTLADLAIDAVKLHNLYVVKDTRLETLWNEGRLDLPPRETYASLVADFLERLPPTTVIDRLSGDVPPPYFVGPPWAKNKHGLRAAIEGELERRDTWQGKLFDACEHRVDS